MLKVARRLVSHLQFLCLSKCYDQILYIKAMITDACTCPAIRVRRHSYQYSISHQYFQGISLGYLTYQVYYFIFSTQKCQKRMQRIIISLIQKCSQQCQDLYSTFSKGQSHFRSLYLCPYLYDRYQAYVVLVFSHVYH